MDRRTHHRWRTRCSNVVRRERVLANSDPLHLSETQTAILPSPHSLEAGSATLARDIAGQGLLDRTPADGHAEQGLDCSVDLLGRHRPIGRSEDLDGSVEDRPRPAPAVGAHCSSPGAPHRAGRQRVGEPSERLLEAMVR